MTTRGLPHSDISGSSLVGSSPKLFAACYVLHRLSCQGIHLCALMYLLRRFFRNTIFEIAAHGSSPWTRSHVWHMKVLLYAVFKERDRDSRPAAIASNSIESQKKPKAAPSKLNSAVP